MPTEPQVQDEAVEQSAPESTDAGTPDVRETLLEGQDVEAPESGEEENAAADEAAAEGAQPEGGDQESSPQGDEDVSEFVRTLQQLGFQDVQDDETGTQRLLEAYAYTAQQMAAIQEQARQQEELARYGAMYLEQQQSQQQTPPPATGGAAPQQEESDAWWNPPKIDPTEVERWREVKLDDNGQPRVDWKDGTPAEVKVAAEQHARYVEKWAEDLVQRPHEVLPKIIEKEFDRLFEQRWNERQQESKLYSFAETVRQENADWMYAKDPRTGGTMIDPTSGQPVLSTEGQEMMQLVEQVAASGVTDPETQWLHAVALYDYIHGQQQTTQQQAAQQAQNTAAEQRRRHVKRGARGAQNRRGSVAPPEEGSSAPQDSTMSPGEQLVQQLQADGAEFI